MGKRSASPEGSGPSPKRRRDAGRSDDEEKGRRRDRSDSRSRSRSRSRDRREDRSDSRDRRRRDRSNSRGRRRGDARQGGPNGAPAPTAAAAAAAPAPPAEPRVRKVLAAGPAGGVYIPPYKLAMMMAEAADKEGAQYQRMTWDALRKSINGLINKVNASNIKHILAEVFAENLVRGRGLFCRSLMKSQMASPPFTPTYAALVAVVNTKFPELGELLLHRVLAQFKRAYKRNDKPVCLAAIAFIAHLANQQVVHEVLPLEVLMLLLETPSNDGVEVAVGFVTEVGALLQDLTPQGLNTVFDRFRAILHEGAIDKRTQFIIENLFAIRKAGFEASGHPAIPAGLDLVEAEDQITHELSLDDKLSPQIELDVFREDPNYAAHEEEYAAIRREILGEESEDEEGAAAGAGSEEEEEEESDEEGGSGEEGGGGTAGGGGAGGPIRDETQTNLVNLRRTIYLTIMSALDFEEAGHKILKMGIPEGQEMELCTMVIECCSQEKTFIKYYALLGERFAKLRRAYCDCFSDCFVRQYQLIHRLETNKLRNVAKFFAHLLSTDGIPWSVLAAVRLTEEDTTSSSRIFIKILFQELAETLGLSTLNARLADPSCQDWFEGIFPQDSPRNMRFSINFFTSIGLGGVTDRMREVLKSLPRLLAERQAAAAAAAGPASSSDSDSSTSSSSSSDSDSSSSSDSDSSSSSSSSSSSDSDSSSGSDSDSSDSEDEGKERRKGSGKVAAASKGKSASPRRRSPPHDDRRRREASPPRRRRSPSREGRRRGERGEGRSPPRRR